MLIEIRPQPFDPWREVAHYQGNMLDKQGKFGATAVFVGTMRDFNEGDDVQSMTLDHYSGMTEKHLLSICDQAFEKFDILDALVLHRVGKIFPNDAIVLVAIWSAHRAAAYEANRFVMEDLKSRAPFWKKETLKEGERWVEKNTPG